MEERINSVKECESVQCGDGCNCAKVITPEFDKKDDGLDDDDVPGYSQRDLEDESVDGEDLCNCQQDKEVINIDPYDCKKLAEVESMRVKMEHNINVLAGELVRKKLLLDNLIQREKDLYVELEKEKEHLKTRYNLTEEYNWDIRVQEEIIVGTKRQ